MKKVGSLFGESEGNKPGRRRRDLQAATEARISRCECESSIGDGDLLRIECAESLVLD